MRLAEVARQPAPALHGGEDGVELLGAARRVDRLDGRGVQLAGDLDAVGLLELADRHGDRGVVVGVGFGGETKALAQQRHAGVRHHGLFALAVAGVAQHRAILDTVANGLVRRVAHLGVFRLQRAVARLRRVELRQRLAEVVGGRDLLQHIVGVERELVVDVRADAAEVHAPGHGMARVGQQRLGELQLGLRLLFRAADVELRHPVVFRIEPIGFDGAEIFDRVVGALARRAFGDPQRL